MPLDDASAKRYARKSAFLEWCEKDGLSVIGGYGVDDLKTASLKHWERWGGPAAYCHLEGSPGIRRRDRCRNLGWQEPQTAPAYVRGAGADLIGPGRDAVRSRPAILRCAAGCATSAISGAPT